MRCSGLSSWSAAGGARTTDDTASVITENYPHPTEGWWVVTVKNTGAAAIGVDPFVVCIDRPTP